MSHDEGRLRALPSLFGVCRMNLKLSMLLASVAVVLVPASAEALVFDLSTIYTGSTPQGTGPWAKITLTDVAANTVNLRFDHNASSVTGQFLTSLYLNLDPFVGSITTSNEVNANKRNGSIDLVQNGVHGAAGNLFDLGVSFNTANSGGGVNRLKPGEFWSIDLIGTGLSSASFNAVNNKGHYVGAHMQGIPGGLSGHITAVPEPATMAALGLGLAGMIRARRKRA